MFWNKNKELEERYKELVSFKETVQPWSLDVEIKIATLEQKLKDLEQKQKYFEEFILTVISQEQNKRIGLGAKIIEFKQILDSRPITPDHAFEVAVHLDQNNIEIPLKDQLRQKKKRSPEECIELSKELKS